MLTIIVAVLLATGDSLVTPPCCKPTTAFHNTEAQHRIGHVVTATVLTTSVYGAARYFGANRKQARWIAAGTSLTAILAKEIHDYHSAAHNFSATDVMLGAAGTAAGVWIADRIHWPEDAKAARLRHGKK